jgi:alkanesulfonate monooxygenase SsuD/methylene tetrahydromethanopterin reductase-like flavin-dependent oxidoreductase (luciferase family)
VPAIGLHADVGVDGPELVRLAALAEARGLSGAYMIEYEYDALPYLLAMAMATERIRLGTSVVRMHARHPLALAESVAAVAEFAPGRLSIGIGSGPAPRYRGGTRVSPWGEPVPPFAGHADRYLETVGRALRGDDVDGVTLPNPPRAPVPLLLAAGGPVALEVAARRADGAFLFLRGETGIRRAAAALPGGMTVAALIPTIVDDDGEVAAAAMRERMQAYLQRPLNRGLLAVEESAAAAVIAGTPEQCRLKLAELVAAGVTEPVLYVMPADGDWGSAYERATEVFA